MLNDLIFLGAALVIIVALYFVLFGRKKGGEKLKADSDLQGTQQQNVQAEAVNPNRQNPRNRFAGRQAQQQVNQPEEEEKKEEEDSDQELTSEAKSLKQLQKEARKQEKKQQQEAMLKMYEEKAKRDEAKRSKYEERDRQREEQQRKIEEYHQKIKEEQEKKAQDEFEMWKDQFTVEESGKEVDNIVSEENLLQNFVNYIKLRKVVMLDDLAAEFRLPTKEVVNRIKSLEESKMLSGIIDDRGKYIYIKTEEMEAIVKYIKRVGRVSRSDLVLECNRQIKLIPSEEDKQKLKQEQSKLLSQVESELKAMESQEVEVRN